jgi:hypothetical protein
MISEFIGCVKLVLVRNIVQAYKNIVSDYHKYRQNLIRVSFVNVKCPHCNFVNECPQIDPHREYPAVGEYYLCASCSEVSVCHERYQLRHPTEEEHIEISENKIITACRLYQLEMKRCAIWKYEKK